MSRRLGIGKIGGTRWSTFDFTLEQVAQTLEKRITEALAEFFVLNGDVCSILYTNSPAMHSALMRDYNPNISGAPINAVIAIQRRYQNIYLDPARQAQYEMVSDSSYCFIFQAKSKIWLEK